MFSDVADFSYSEDMNTIVERNGKLRVEDGQLVNEAGEVVQLRGMSTHGLAWNPNTYNEESLRTLVDDWGITLFRIAVYTHEWGGYCTEQWKSKEAYNDEIDKLVQLCGKLGIYCIIDWHILNEGSGDPNFTLEDAKIFWKEISKRYSHTQHVLYEICNEPNGANVDWAVVKRYAEQIIPVIRQNDPSTVIICGTPTWSQDVDKAVLAPLSYGNLMYALHFYAGTHGAELRQRADKALQQGLPIFVTEFGLSRADGNGGVFVEACDEWMKWTDAHHLSWANWSFSDIDESSAALQHGAVAKRDWNRVSASGEYVKGRLLQSRQK